MSLTFTLTGKESILSANFHRPLQLDSNEYVSIRFLDFESYFTVPNVDLRNNKSYYGPENTPPIEIPIGAYEIDELAQHLHDEMANVNIAFSLRTLSNQSKIRIRCDDEIRFNDGKIKDPLVHY